jgi:hypothetical protein
MSRHFKETLKTACQQQLRHVADPTYDCFIDQHLDAFLQWSSLHELSYLEANLFNMSPRLKRYSQWRVANPTVPDNTLYGFFGSDEFYGRIRIVSAGNSQTPGTPGPAGPIVQMFPESTTLLL